MFLKNCWYVAAWDHELLDAQEQAEQATQQAAAATAARKVNQLGIA